VEKYLWNKGFSLRTLLNTPPLIILLYLYVVFSLTSPSEAGTCKIEEGEGTVVDRPRGRRAFSWQKLAADEEAAAARAAGASPASMVNFDVNPVSEA
jgi:hypothetical protein